EFFKQRNYRPKTIISYITALENLFNFHANTSPSEINFTQLSDFTYYLLKRKKSSSSTARIHLAAFDHFYNTLLGKNFDINSLKPTVSHKPIPEVLTPAEVSKLLDSLKANTKHYIVISLLYSAGLEISHVLNLKLEDIDCLKKQINIRDENGKIFRI